jgi:hypothetical protein
MEETLLSFLPLSVRGEKNVFCIGREGKTEGQGGERQGQRKSRRERDREKARVISVRQITTIEKNEMGNYYHTHRE